MRKRGKVDKEHPAIVAYLRKLTIAATSTASIGDGFPDIAWAWRGVTGLLEVKTDNEKLTKAEAEFHARWPAEIPIVRNAEEAAVAVFRIAGVSK